MTAMLDESAILSAADLGLSEKERMALIQTRRMLLDDSVPYPAEYGKPGFNMNYEARRFDCGAACCIGGHMSLIMQGAMPDNGVFKLNRPQSDIAASYVRDKKEGHKIGKLFYPEELYDIDHKLARSWHKITPEMAIAAIDSFLMTGKPNWKSAVSAA